MSAYMSDIFRANAALARAIKASDEPAQTDARRNLAEAKIAHAIDKSLATAPPLSDSQIARLSSLLGGA